MHPTTQLLPFTKRSYLCKLVLFISSFSGYPKINLVPRGDYQSTINDHVMFECYATGYPTPTITWTFPEDVEAIDGTVTTWPGYGRIQMKANATKQGKYICNASNIVGEAMDWITFEGMRF